MKYFNLIKIYKNVLLKTKFKNKYKCFVYIYKFYINYNIIMI